MERPERKSVRLKEYDYRAPGYYFVTICTYQRKCILSAVGPATGGLCALTDLGRIVETGLGNIPHIYPRIKVDKYCIMPNHMHVILIFEEKDGGPPVAGPTLGGIVNKFKGFVAREVGYKVWQEDFYEHVLRSKTEYLAISHYIDENPLKWSEDEYYVQ